MEQSQFRRSEALMTGVLTRHTKVEDELQLFKPVVDTQIVYRAAPYFRDEPAFGP